MPVPSMVMSPGCCSPSWRHWRDVTLSVLPLSVHRLVPFVVPCQTCFYALATLHGWGQHWWLVTVVVWKVSIVGACASSILSLLVVTENQLSSSDSLLPPFPFKDSSPWTVLDVGTWSPDTLEVSLLASREVVVSDDSWLVYHLPPLLPILLVKPQMEGSSGRRSYERRCRVLGSWWGRQVCVWWWWRLSPSSSDQLDVLCFLLVLFVSGGLYLGVVLSFLFVSIVFLLNPSL
jgi:hypothetical protein